MTRYVLPISLGFGNIGNFILIGYFSQKHNRTNPCSLYLLAAAVFSIVGSNWGVIPTVYAIFYSDPLSKSIVLCRIRLYIIYISAMSYRTMIVLATIDRYALTNARLISRAFSSITVAKRAIIIMFLFWCMAGFHLLIWPTIEYNRCLVYGLYGFVYSIIQLITLGVLPNALMILFGVLLTKNLRLSRIRFEIATRQAINTNSRALRRRDKNLIVLVFTEILLTFICTFPYSLHAIYTALTNNIPNKSVERQQIESFLYFFFVQYLLYLGYSTTFYGYMATSKSFRREVQILLLKLIGKTSTAIEQEPIEINVPRIITR
ncbi:hypothetical protein I4U23_004736 [Adineta vaga]|nr:hypothetical protein I4U23_004736 [Adineta vaga]